MANETDTTSEVARVLREHFDPTGTERHDPYAAAVYEEAAATLAEAGLLRPQIATQEPAERTQADSAGRGASGGLGERLRALVTGADPKATYEAVDVGLLGRLADEADVLEAAYRVADAEIARLGEFHDHYRAQVEAIRAAITREAAHGDAITRCNLVAERFQTVLDSLSAP